MRNTIKSLEMFTKNTVITLALTSLVAAATSGCATPEEIDRTQPNLMAKSAFEGEWYLLDTIVEAPYGARSGFTGLQSDLQRGAWVIEEKHLILYRTYEFVEGVETQGIKGDTDSPLLDAEGNEVKSIATLDDGTEVEATVYLYQSAPLARYKIEGHYDVRKQYNPLTGEETNVLVEDSSEKFWWQREFFRVDFGADTAKNNARLTWVGDDQSGNGTTLYEGEVGAEGIELRVDDEGTYIDFVARIPYPVPSIWYGGWGWVPQCYFASWWTGGYYECNTELMHIRTSLMRVPEHNGYMPMQYNDHMLGKFGYYRSSRADWDQYYGTTFSDAIRHIRRFDIWEEWTSKTVTAGDDTIEVPDFENMTPKPIVYYLSEDFPRELIAGAVDLADEWNKPYQEVVEAYGHEGVRMYILCENSKAEAQEALANDANAVIAEVDNPLCLDMDQAKRFGDLRYNLLVSVNDPTQYGLYGYGPMHSDPITGRTVHANAFNYTANMKLGARHAVDMIEYAAGVQSFRDVTQAAHITTKLKAEALANTSRAPKAPASIEDAQQAAAGVIPGASSLRMVTEGIETTDTNFARAQMAKLLGAEEYDFVWKNADMAAAVGMPIFDLDEHYEDDGFLESLTHPYAAADEDLMLWGEKQIAARGQQNICMGTEFDDSFRGLAAEYKAVYDKTVCEGLLEATQEHDLVFDFSVFDLPTAECDKDANVCGDKQLCVALDQGEASSKYCVTPCNVEDLLQQLRDEIRLVNQIAGFVYWDPNALYADVKDERVMHSQQVARDLIEGVREEVFLEVFDRIWATVAMHEVGHNVGLRHNFASSTDALNFFDEYWDIKGFTDGKGHYHPKNLWERDTTAQSSAKLREFQQTSIMEYTGSFNAREQGVGAYDDAAIHFGYGELLNHYTNGPDMAELETMGYMDDPEDEDPTNFAISALKQESALAHALRKIHHTQYPNVFGSVDNLTSKDLASWWDMIEEPCSVKDDPFDSGVCAEAGSFCQPFPTGYYCTKPDVVEVPYRFCSDEYNYSSSDCQTRDEGVDVFEIVANSVDDYEAYWPFVAYKRDNDLFFPTSSYYGWVQARFLQWRKHFEFWAYDYARYNQGDWWEEKFGVPWHLDVNGGLGGTLAMKEIFTTMANVFSRPSTGYYGWDDEDQQYEPYVQDGTNQYCNLVQVQEDQGARPIYPSFSFGGYLYTPARAGTFYDRLAAYQLMTYPQFIFVRGADTYYDTQRFRMNFADVWPQRMQNIFAAMITSEPAAYGWCVEHGMELNENGEEVPVFDLDNPCDSDPLGVKERIWFGTEEEIQEYYTDCEPLNPEPQYTFPTSQYRLPALAAIYGFGWMSRNYDRSFIDRSRIWLKGEGAETTIPEGFEIVEFLDLFSGKTYVSFYDPMEYDPYVRIEPEDLIPADDVDGPHGHGYWPAAKLITLANNLSYQYTNPPDEGFQYSELQQVIGRMEIIRGLYRTYEFGY